MKYTLLAALIIFNTTVFSQTETPPTKTYDIKPVPFTQVKISDDFWAPRIRTVEKVTIPYALQQCEETGRIRNFEIAGGLQKGAFCSAYPFDDSDVFKIIEGASYVLHQHPDSALDARLDALIAKIAAAQEGDGYLYSWRTVHEHEDTTLGKDASNGRGLSMAGEQRWMQTDQHSHELYNLGHLYEAAVAHHLATGKRTLLDVALKSADLVERTFGWGKFEKAPGHQEIETGLVKLYKLTGEQRYLDLAKFFLDVRGYGDAYMQNHKKVKDQTEVVGHAVRACYMYSGMADVASLTSDSSYVRALNSLWDDVIGGKVYVTGGIGSAGSNEGFTEAYDLPNFSAYCETCASIAFVLWNQRMFQLTGEAKYIDVLERTLYNSLNAGLSLNGDRFFYPNPLESRKNTERSPWFTCACCPSNVVRFFPSLPGYIYAKWGNTVFVNLFASSETTVKNVNSRLQLVGVTIRQQTGYPWDGHVKITVVPEKPNTFTLKIRIPGWARGDAFPGDLYSFENKNVGNIALRINGKAAPMNLQNGYATIERKWRAGDVVELTLPMLVNRVLANSKVSADAGKTAFQRGPIVFCLEGKDQSDDRVLNLLVAPENEVIARFETDLLSGVETLSFTGALVTKKSAPEQAKLKPLFLKAIPYYAWANRGPDNMTVWVPQEVGSARPVSPPSIAAASRISFSEGMKGDAAGIADQWLPAKSSDKENPFVHWWPHSGTTEWLQYDFEKPETVSTVRVYWFDDEDGGGGCRIPKSWRVLYLDDGAWVPVFHDEGFPTTKDGWDEARFELVRTTALRLEIQCSEGVSAGVQEWEVR